MDCIEPSLRERELEKQLEKKAFKILSLEKQLSDISAKQAQQEIKYRNACETREEWRFKAKDLEGQVNSLKCENENLKTTKGPQEITLENLLATYEGEISRCKEQLKMQEEKLKSFCNNEIEIKQEDQLNSHLILTENCDKTESKDKEKLDAYELKIVQLENELKEKSSIFMKEQSSWKNKEAILTENLRKCEENLQEEKLTKSALLEKLKSTRSQELINAPENSHPGGGITQIKNELEELVKKPLQESNKIQTEICDHLRKMEQQLSSLQEKQQLANNFQIEKMNGLQQANQIKPKIPGNGSKQTGIAKKAVKQEKAEENISNVNSQKIIVKLERIEENVSDVTPQKRTVLQEISEESTSSNVPPQKVKLEKNERGPLKRVPPSRKNSTAETRAGTSVKENVANVENPQGRKLRSRRN